MVTLLGIAKHGHQHLLLTVYLLSDGLYIQCQSRSVYKSIYVPLGNQEDSVLIELIHELIGLATCQQNPAAAQQAAGCLGEIGPANLHTIAIKVGGGEGKQWFNF